ncbi:MAG: Hcp family type VI secretion system effector [Acidobacteria bacterium]|nr:Hcp family type VI secretion system effector [Acidobacteriota bacterium]
MPLPSHLTLKGVNQGQIEGSCDQEGREGTIQVQALNHEVSIPRDAQTGLATGKRIHHPLTILKAFDKSTPLLYQALTSGEHMEYVEIKWYRIDDKGVEEHYFTTRLEDAIIVSIKPGMNNCLDKNTIDLPHLEEVSFTYRKAIWRWEPDGIESEDDWRAPK